MRNEWTGFVPGVWEKEIDVRDFIQKNYTPYDGDDAFLAGPTEDTKALWQQVQPALPRQPAPLRQYCFPPEQRFQAQGFPPQPPMAPALQLPVHWPRL